MIVYITFIFYTFIVPNDWGNPNQRAFHYLDFGRLYLHVYFIAFTSNSLVFELPSIVLIIKTTVAHASAEI